MSAQLYILNFSVHRPAEKWPGRKLFMIIIILSQDFFIIRELLENYPFDTSSLLAPLSILFHAEVDNISVS